jgi:hypothetical protein
VCNNYNFEESEINVKTILNRTKPGQKLIVKHRGTNSPDAGTDAHLLADILRRAVIRQPVYCAEGLALANSFIDGTPAQTDFMQWKSTHLKNGSDHDSFGNLWWWYWQNFCRRNKEMIGVGWIILRTCIIECMENYRMQPLQRCCMMRCGWIDMEIEFKQRKKHPDEKHKVLTQASREIDLRG